MEQERTRLYHGVIKGSSYIDGALAYSVFIENYHIPDSPPHLFAKGIPIFIGPENNVRYKKETRVAILIKDSDFSTVYVVGRIFDRYKLDGSTPNVKEGQSALSDPNDISGIIGLGESGQLKIWSGSSSLGISDVNILGLIGGNRSFELTKNISYIGNKNAALSLGVDSTLLSKGNISLISEDGGISLTGNSISIKSIGSVASFKSVKEMEISSPLLLIKSGAFKFQGSIGSAFGPEATVDFNILSGDFKTTIGSGDYDLRILEPIGKIKLDLGYPVSLGRLEINESEIILENPTSELSLSSLGDIKLANSLSELSISKTAEVKLKNAIGSLTISQSGGLELKGGTTTKLPQKMVLGETLTDLLKDILKEIKLITVTAPPLGGVTGTPLNASAFTVIEGKINNALSLVNKNN